MHRKEKKAKPQFHIKVARLCPERELTHMSKTYTLELLGKWGICFPKKPRLAENSSATVKLKEEVDRNAKIKNPVSFILLPPLECN